MNKKIIAIAIATAMAAPAAMADIKISGHMGGHLTFSPKDATGVAVDETKSSREFGDLGRARLNFDGTSGNAYARIAYNDANQGRNNMREALAGYKLGGGTSVQFGRMPGALKNLEKDPYIATFLQLRKTAAEAATASAFGSSGFVGSLLELKMKMGAMGFKGQYDPSDNALTSAHSGHIALALTGKAGAVNYWVGYNNGAANSNDGTATNQTNYKVGASMKMGAAKITVNVTDFEKGSGGNKSTSTVVMANFGLGNGLSLNGLYAGNGDTGTILRLAVAKKLAKGATLYGGAVTKTGANGGTAVTTFGAGMTVKF